MAILRSHGLLGAEEKAVAWACIGPALIMLPLPLLIAVSVYDIVGR